MVVVIFSFFVILFCSDMVVAIISILFCSDMVVAIISILFCSDLVVAIISIFVLLRYGGCYKFNFCFVQIWWLL
jgi:hypothetical protein